MKTQWDYSELADAYLERPPYSETAISDFLSHCGISDPTKVCDVGAGVAHLTIMLAERGHDVTAVEPNDNMRENGIKRTSEIPNVDWFEGTGENTGQPDDTFDLVTFGSSFNVCDQELALHETSRILKPQGWLACLWNHRNLEDPIQKHIEDIIKSFVPDYSYGTRRADQTEVINTSGLFDSVTNIKGEFVFQQDVEACVVAWRSHATLQRQTKEKFHQVVNTIEEYLAGLGTESIPIPYTTTVYVAQLKMTP